MNIFFEHVGRLDILTTDCQFEWIFNYGRYQMISIPNFQIDHLTSKARFEFFDRKMCGCYENPEFRIFD